MTSTSTTVVDVASAVATPAPCPVCGAPGRPLHARLADRVHAVPGTWNSASCTNDACDAQWITPRPSTDEILGFYVNYETHSSTDGQTDARMPSWYPSPFSRRQRQRREESVLPTWLPVAAPGRVFEIGCGNGVNLLRLRSLGWTVAGQDFDPVAVTTATAAGLDVGPSLDQVVVANGGTFNVVLLSHVIEHLHDITEVLAQAAALLVPGGVVVVMTPNGRSLSAKVFRSWWRGLEAPRHLQVFGPQSLFAVLEANGFENVCVQTSYLADGYLAGRSLAPGSGHGALAIRGLASVTAQVAADLVLCRWRHRGGELIATATKP